jgi:hypothetical protein
MKTILLTLVVFQFTSAIYAQNSFENELFSAKVALKYRTEIGLSMDQVASIQEIYTSHITEFEIMRFDLEAELSALDNIIGVSAVNEEAAISQLQKVLRLEENLKKVRLMMLVRIKNVMDKEQQEKLKMYRTENDVDGFLMTTPINSSQKVTLQLNGIIGNLQPLFILKTAEEEKEVTRTMIQNLNTSEIESINVIKGEAAIEQFGEKGKNGVVYIEMKQNP